MGLDPEISSLEATEVLLTQGLGPILQGVSQDYPYMFKNCILMFLTHLSLNLPLKLKF